MSNKILQLKGSFQTDGNHTKPAAPNIPEKGLPVDVDHLRDLKQQLEEILKYWQAETLIGGALVSVYYNKIVAKSNRLKGLLAKGNIKPNDSVRGAKFDVSGKQHIFTHFVSLDILSESIRRLNACIKILEKDFNGSISHADMKPLNAQNTNYSLPISIFKAVIVDCYYVQKFNIDRDIEKTNENTIVTLYKTNVKTTELLNKLGITSIDAALLDETTVRLTPDELDLLRDKAPYLIAMETVDIRKLSLTDISSAADKILTIPDPTTEPVVGVIDTLFDDGVYFKNWVEFKNMLDPELGIDPSDYKHGTFVTSIIVDGPAFNPNLEDNCGNFRVKHFGVAKSGYFSSFTVLKAIRQIVSQNREIKVWNLSLGSVLEINNNFISPEGAELDKIQSEYDVIFIVAGTNRPESRKFGMKIGAPADSLNSLVVNSVDFNDKPASYTRVGPVLSFFNKPDVSYYGGDGKQKIRVCSSLGEYFVTGTSFAAPWITRKMAFLICKLGLSREVAKALIIDSAAKWNRQDNVSYSMGYGIVAKDIRDIVESPADEIRFILTGVSEAYETYAYNIPVPYYDNKYPFFARATLCYFPTCSRIQGVDYTNTEMDIHFGRLKEDGKGKTHILSLDKNAQGDEGNIAITEESARSFYRKWDNIKHIADTIKKGSRPKSKFNADNWGLSIKTKERLQSKHGAALPFAVVVTLKEMNGINRIGDFIKLCQIRNWLVSEVNIDNLIDVQVKAEETIDFE